MKKKGRDQSRSHGLRPGLVESGAFDRKLEGGAGGRVGEDGDGQGPGGYQPEECRT